MRIVWIWVLLVLVTGALAGAFVVGLEATTRSTRTVGETATTNGGLPRDEGAAPATSPESVSDELTHLGSSAEESGFPWSAAVPEPLSRPAGATPGSAVTMETPAEDVREDAHLRAMLGWCTRPSKGESKPVSPALDGHTRCW